MDHTYRISEGRKFTIACNYKPTRQRDRGRSRRCCGDRY